MPAPFSRLPLLLVPLALCCSASEGLDGSHLLTLRAECDPTTPGAFLEPNVAFDLWVGPPQTFHYAYVGPTPGIAGQPAIALEVVEEEKAAFEAMTEKIVNKRLAIYLDGHFHSAPNVEGPLPGGFIITGGLDGWSQEERDSWVLRLRGE